MKLKTEKYILPAYFAPYLINGDIEGIDLNELNEIDNFMIANNLLNCLNVSDNYEFRWRNDMNNIGDDCLEYTFGVK